MRTTCWVERESSNAYFHHHIGFFPQQQTSWANASVLSHRLITVPMTAVFKLLRTTQMETAPLRWIKLSILHVILDPALVEFVFFIVFFRADYLIPLTWDDLSSIHIILSCWWWVNHSHLSIPFGMINTVSHVINPDITLCGWLGSKHQLIN